jgi:cobalt-zinc-cadmium efflux system membrane fusion protein
VNEDQKISFVIPNIGQDVFEANIVSVSRTVQVDSRVVKVLAEYSNINANLLPGMFVAGTIHAREQKVEALPEEAIIIEGTDKNYIFYTLSSDKDDPMIFKRIYLGTGFIEDGYVQVDLEENLPEDARIVVKGAYYVKAEMMKGEE